MFSRHPDFRTPDAASEARVQAILDRMTLEEKIACLGGSTQDKVDDGNTVPCPRVGLPSLRMADASVGVHWWTEDSTTFPAPIALAASFDPELAYRYGAAIGRECRARGIHILLGPGVNLYRSALCGRNFEYLGEDPCLAGRMVVGYIRGLQDQGVAATVKHYACNFQEYSRHRVSTDVDERTLREVYLAAFEAAVKDGGAGAVMTAYNRVNGQWCAEHHHLLTDILKGAWGFDGLAMSDWVSVYDTVNTALAGLDLEMPRAQWLTLEKLLPLVKNGVVPEAVIADKVRRLLRLAVAFGWLDRPQRDATIPLHDETSAAVARDVAVAGTVLLKNDGVLPLDASPLRRIAVIGPSGHPAVIGGGGSAFNKPWRSVSIAEGIKAVFPQIEVLVEAGVDLWRQRKIFETSVFSTPEGEPGLHAEFFSNPDLGGQPCLVRTEPRCIGRLTPADLPAGLAPLSASLRLRGVFQVPRAGEYAIPIEAWNGGLRVALDGRVLIEAWSAEVMGDRMHVLDLAAGAHELVVEFHGMRTRSFVMAGYEPTAVMRIGVPAALAAARSADLVIFCGGHTDKNEGEARDRDFAMHGEIERLLLAVLDANPNTVAVMTAGGNLDMRTWHDRVRALLWAWYPGQEGGTALARILAGLDEPGGRLPATFEHRPEDRSSHDCYHDHDGDLRVTLRDGVFGGYRHHDRNGVTPRYPFGFGLGYTRFAFRDLELRSADGGFPVEVSFTVENTGRRRGSTVAQVYVGEQRPCLPRPVKELKGFSKVTLDPGESRRVSVALQRRDFCFWDSTAGDWRLHPGRFTIAVGASAAEIVLSGETTCGTTQEGMSICSAAMTSRPKVRCAATLTSDQ